MELIIIVISAIAMALYLWLWIYIEKRSAAATKALRDHVESWNENENNLTRNGKKVEPLTDYKSRPSLIMNSYKKEI